MNIEKQMNLNNEVIDSIYSFFKGAQTLFENDEEIATIYSYLLLQATGIERLQKLYLILKHHDDFNEYIGEQELKKYSHKIFDTYKSKFEQLISDEDKKLIEKSLEIIGDIVNSKRYVNFSNDNNKIFNIHSHITKIIEIQKINSSKVIDNTKFSWKILDVVLKKYIAILISDIWHGEVGKGLIIPICLKEYVLNGLKDLELLKEINKIYEMEKKYE